MIGLALLMRTIVSAQLATTTGAAPATTTAPATDPSGDRVIVSLVCRQHIAMVTSTNAGVRYSITDKTGRAIVSSVTLETLKADHPEIYRLITPAVCATDSRHEVIADVMARD